MAKMNAARWYGAKDVRIEEVDVPEVQPHQVKIAVKYTGICGTATLFGLSCQSSVPESQ